MKLTLVSFALWVAASAVSAQVPDLYKGADLQLGEQLLVQHKCTSCHVGKVGGDGSAMYKPQGRINSLGALRGMVEACDQALNVGLFPEEVNSISAVLNRDHYHFSR